MSCAPLLYSTLSVPTIGRHHASDQFHGLRGPKARLPYASRQGLQAASGPGPWEERRRNVLLVPATTSCRRCEPPFGMQRRPDPQRCSRGIPTNAPMVVTNPPRSGPPPPEAIT